MGRRLRRTMTVLGVLAICAAAAVAPACAQAFTARVGVSAAATGRPVGSGFLGLALEVNEIPALAGATPQSVDPVFVQLLHNLDPAGRPSLRIGGQSTDRSWWPVKGMAVPAGVTYDLSAKWTASARTLAQATGAKLLLGVNLEADRTRIAQVEGANLLHGIGAANIDALEIGNEPDLYPLVPWYKLLNGRRIPWYERTGSPVFSRRPSYGPAQFDAEFARTARVLPRLPLAGPETGNWLDPFSRFLSPRSQLRILTSHAYGLNQCVTDPSSPQYPSVSHLVSKPASRDLLAGLAPYIALAHRDGAAFRVDEMGSISCNGRAGVSNTTASALWVMDSLFSIAAAGVDGVNLHTYPNSVNGLFDLTRSAGAWRATVHPLYYGALMFAQAAPAGARLLRVAAGNQDRLRAWATRAPDGHVRVLLINDSLRSSALALVHAPAGFAAARASVERMTSPGPYATGHVSLGGQSFGTSTSSGVPAAPVAQTVSPRAGGFAITLAPGSAALLTLSAES